MKENVNLVSSTLPDLSTKALPKNDVLSSKGSEFKKTFDTAIKKAEPRRADLKAKDDAPVEVKSEAVSVSSNKVAKTLSPASSVNSSELPIKTLDAEKENFDDEKGLIAQSYSETAVSYPVSRIASESIDEKTKVSLQEQGLWNLPTMVMAQPSEQLVAMKEVATADLTESTTPVAKPIAQFMASLENELGVKSDRLVQAFRKLPPGQLSLSPEKTMLQVVKNLKLDPADEAKATELFTRMLAQLRLQSDPSGQGALMASSVAAAQMAQPQSNFKEVETPVKGQAKKEMAALGYAKTDALAQANSALPKTEVESIPVKAEAKGDIFKLQKNEAAQTEAKVGEKENVSKSQTKANVNVAQTENAKASLSTAGMEQTAPTRQEQIVVPQAKPELTNAEAQPQAQADVAAQVTGLAGAQTQSQGEGRSQGQLSQGNQKSVVKEVASKDKTEVSLKGLGDANSMHVTANNAEATAPQVQNAKSEVSVGTGAAALEMRKEGDPKHEAIKSIVNQAQMLANKGGGEIRMTLKPDHMGEIQLKVAMEGNKVNVQMTTDRSEVKKLIEQSVHELRHGLASHNLSMEKLDVALNQRDMGGFSKGQPDFSQAQEFSQQFHGQQQERREMMNDLSSLRSNARNSLSTMDRSAQAQRTMANLGKTSGRLNVVA